MAVTNAIFTKLMRETNYKIFKSLKTNDDGESTLSIIVPRKCILFYKNRDGKVDDIRITTRSAVKYFEDFKMTISGDSKFYSKYNTVEISMKDMEKRLTVQNVKFLKNERFFLFVDSTPILTINHVYTDENATDIEFYDSMKYIGSLPNGVVNVIVDVDKIEMAPSKDKNSYVDVTFAVYKLRTSSVMHLKDVVYRVPYILLTEDFNYNKDTLTRLYNKIYEEMID